VSTPVLRSEYVLYLKMPTVYSNIAERVYMSSSSCIFKNYRFGIVLFSLFNLFLGHCNVISAAKSDEVSSFCFIPVISY
jgi:hypothetical protein